ncbi:MAG: dihydroxy-acid dehydratase [Opitutaceae bacterium]|nr:dihydroxy-acid dehydratase [Opitutaceae bacterium]
MSSSAPTGFRKNLTSYGDPAFSLFLRSAFIKGAGYTDDALSRPIVGIASTASGFNPCHGNAPDLIAAVRRGVLLAGGLPVEFPTISIHESFAHPTSMYLRNLMAMDTEEMIRAQPMDSVVLIGGCDKTVPAQLMGAISAGVPAIQLVTGSMLTGSHHGERVGACTDCRRFWGAHRGGEIDAAQIAAINDQLVASVGTCSVMGTASTMACLAEALGLALPGSASPPAVTADRMRIAEKSGAAAVAMIAKRLTPGKIITPSAIENALRVLLAIGGSTNGLIHLTAIAGRAGITIDFAALDALGRETPVLVDLKPTGRGYMEDFHRAGGLTAVLRELRPLLHLDALTVTGRTLGEELDAAVPGFPQEIVRSRAAPVFPEGGLAFLRGNLAPGGALIKHAAATPALLEHEGRAVVFANAEDIARRIDDPALDVSADDILVLQNIGPVGAPGMPEAGYLPIPRKLARQGVKDMVRISDGRMSGTAAGTIVLHVTPESAIGGPLAAVRTGDRIRLSVARRELTLLIPAAEITARLAQRAVQAAPERGYARLFHQHITQADRGCDFDFLRPADLARSAPVCR